MSEEFTVHFDGAALRDGQMDVRELAPALLGLADAVAAASGQLEPSTPRPGLAINASREGSFIVELSVTEPGLLERVADLFNADGTTAVLNLAGVVGLLFGGFKFVSHLNKRIRRTEEQDGEVVVTFEDGEQITISAEVFKLSTNVEFRRSVRSVVLPLHRDGVDEVRLTHREERVVIQQDQLPAFEVPAVEEELVLDREEEVALSLMNVAFVDGNKWRFSEGDVAFWAPIEDMSFRQRVDTNQEAFAAGDVLRVRMRVRQWNTASGLNVERSIVEVLEHLPAPRSVPLPLTDPQDDS